ncbi:MULTISPECIES: acetyl-CoA carboxylase biotin carboxyl carrier protein [unclassified Clostridioides]|uniref:acetyl-CoA carboxylase biotin carboxyl carrier protein n=1 Tax=unclassified Clostridioides TaxID=2635829 RepID=UPI001D0CBCBA|nr:acetyl-CoA carboxylase biotin carboxyl carrier protein [Clostridioides sp. ES-S-0001-02]MCC0638596.1 acetyl-CoA carboxylase biotin carboxyl carrier protein [Clostridioides sp. ES-S-0049-03]MCC0652565.1 acetyl-CoA carboxylase biotin carboxyl carrier protein [Clostridioides sp. ES-S-0001-03]MCC0655241.1 acetyl-CoA carboxylase biotin carboxyl carrier protein [Clostridioides sp. ES-S-0123-01]MCC0672961.1 acetyl-CoA carboxylase biotin carboxyl carrier protein [Clostridioides sp. ES-S-0145-01]MCC
MNINEIKELLKVIDSTNLEYVKLESSDFKLEASKKTEVTSSPVLSVQQESVVDLSLEKPFVNEEPVVSNENLSIVVAPLMGTFYDSPSPDAEGFVKVGDVVEEGDTLCILEAMKLMNEITSEIKGEIIEVLVDNEELVEYNQPLFKIKPL